MSRLDNTAASRLFGFHPVREALRHRPHELLRVWSARARSDQRQREIASLCERHGVPCEPMPPELAVAWDDSVHNGFVAELQASATHAARRGGDPELVVLVEDVQDPRNLGALLRVCEGAGAGQVLIRDRGSAKITPTVAKTSAGASEWLPIERITNTARTIQELKDAGFWVYGVAGGGDPVWEVELTGKVAFCFGGEEHGLRALTRQRCDRLVGLPMKGRVESLNLSTAVAAVLYEALRQRGG